MSSLTSCRSSSRWQNLHRVLSPLESPPVPHRWAFSVSSSGRLPSKWTHLRVYSPGPQESGNGCGVRVRVFREGPGPFPDDAFGECHTYAQTFTIGAVP